MMADALRVGAPSTVAVNLPAFVAGDDGPVRSYCIGAWGGLAQGVTLADSTNKPNALVRLRYLKLAALHQALRILLRRHTVLNSRLEDRDGSPWICPVPDAEFNVRVIDLGARETPDSRADAERILSDLVWERFDHHAGPLYRALAVKAGDEYYIGLVAHHFVADSQSIGILMYELTQLHDALARRQTPRLPRVELRYQDYLRGICDWIGSDAGIDARRAVQHGLVGGAAPQFDTAPPGADDRQYFIVDSAVTQSIRLAARTLGTSVFTVLLAAQNAIAASRTAARRTVCKVITSGREASSLIPIVGNMADRIYVSTDISGRPSFAELVRRTHESFNRSRKLAFVRADFVQEDMNAIGLSTSAPVFNFRSVRRRARSEGASAPAPPSSPLGVRPARVDKVTRPRDAYYLEIVDDGSELWGSVRYGQGKIRDFLQDLEDVLKLACADTSLGLHEIAAMQR